MCQGLNTFGESKLDAVLLWHVSKARGTEVHAESYDGNALCGVAPANLL